MGNAIQVILTVLATSLTAAITMGVIPKIIDYFDAKTNNENVKAALIELERTVSTSVGYINQTFVNQLKSDGRFDMDSQKRALTDATTEVIRGLSQTTKDIISRDDNKLLKEIAIRWIEDEIQKKK